MLVNFQMMMFNDLNEHMETFEFKVFGKMEDNTLIFPDKMIPNTKYFVTILDNEVLIKRVGTIFMEQRFVMGQYVDGIYRINENIEFLIGSETEKLEISENMILIEYAHYFDGTFHYSNKLKIIF